MLTLRIRTNNNSEEVNDKYAYKVINSLGGLYNNIVISYLSDSLGTTFFIRTKSNTDVLACDYGTAIILLNSMVMAIYPNDTEINLVEVLD